MEKKVKVGCLTYAAGTGEDYINFLADENDPEEFAYALARRSVLSIIVDGSTYIIPAASVRRVWFSEVLHDPRRHRPADVTFYDEE